MKMDARYVVKTPVITEESQIQTAKANQYTFKVNPKANKIQIRDAVEAMFPGIHVVRVNTMNYDGKFRQQGRQQGRRAHWKKAMVTLRAGEKIELI
jgi:large subunit ribosomal protein L23